jgi:hypothetical protein
LAFFSKCKSKKISNNKTGPCSGGPVFLLFFNYLIFMKRDFKGIWIPKEIWLNENLTLQEKVFLVEIESLDNEN